MIYLIFNESETVCKIGYTANDPVKRLKSLQTAQAEKLYISHFILGGTKQEKELHKLFANFRLNGEWFTLDNSIIKYFEDNKSLNPEDYLIGSCNFMQSFLLQYLIWHCEKNKTDLFCDTPQNIDIAIEWIYDKFLERLNYKQLNNCLIMLPINNHVTDIKDFIYRINKKYLSEFYNVDAKKFAQKFKLINPPKLIKPPKQIYIKNDDDRGILLTLSTKIVFGRYRFYDFINILKEDFTYGVWITTIWEGQIDVSLKELIIKLTGELKEHKKVSKNLSIEHLLN